MTTDQQEINITNSSNGSSIPNPSVYGNVGEYLNLVVPLYQSAITGDWDAAKIFFNRDPNCVTLGLNKNLDTTLHAAATTKETKRSIEFMKKLVNKMTDDELKLTNNDSNTAFWIASATGKTKMAKIMMEKNPGLINIRGKDGHFPLTAGAKAGSYDIVKLLYNHSNKMDGSDWTDNDRDFTLLSCVENDMFDLALQMLEAYPNLSSNHVSVLEILARKPHGFIRNKRYLQDYTEIIVEAFRYIRRGKKDSDAMKLLKNIWGHVMRTKNPNEIEDMLGGPPSRILFIAAEKGNTEFIVELLQNYPDLVLDTNDDGLTIFHIAVMHRHQGIYELLNEIGDDYNNTICVSCDNRGNNMLHLVGKTTKEMGNLMSGALLMRRELAWFEEVKLRMPSYLREAKNEDGQTPSDLFSKENEYLITKGLKLMKECMVVAALLITVAFAIVFTIPGGYDLDHGFPIFIHEPTFIAFVCIDAISLITSTVSLIMFLTVLTSSTNKLALINSISRRLIICILLLSASTIAMVATFIASFFVIYKNNLRWIPISIAIYAIQPVFLFLQLQYPYFMDMIMSMEHSSYIFQPKKRVLYTTKPRVSLD